MKKLYTILVGVAVVGVAAVGYAMSAGSGSTATEPVALEGLDDPQALVAMAQGMVKGEEQAPVTIVEFGDYQCPGCGQFASLVEPQITTEYVETGKARFVFFDFPLVNIHANSFLAARAVRCAADQDPDKGWDLHSTLYGRQGQWSASSKPAAEFVAYAQELGLDTDAFRTCLDSDRHADVVTANLRLGEQLGVDRTPTVMVSERGKGTARRVGLGGSDWWEDISAAVDSVLGARGGPDAGDAGSGGE